MENQLDIHWAGLVIFLQPMDCFCLSRAEGKNNGSALHSIYRSKRGDVLVTNKFRNGKLTLCVLIKHRCLLHISLF